MEKSSKKMVWFWFVSAFLMPPFLWTFVTWYCGLFNTNEALQSLTSPLPPVYVSIFLAIILNILKKRLKEIESWHPASPPEQLYKVQKNLAHLPRFFVVSIIMFCIIGPHTSLHGFEFIDQTEYILGSLFAVPVIAMYAIPFLIMFTSRLESWASHIPMSQRAPIFGFRQRMYIVSLFTSVGSLMVILLFVYTLLYELPGISLQVLVIKLAVIGCFNLLLIFIAITSHTIPLAGQVNKLTNLSIQVSQGDFSQRIETKHRDEIGLMLYSINRVCEKVGSGIGKVAGVSQELEQGVGEQAAAIQQASASLEQMVLMIKKNADNVQQTDELMNDTDTRMKDAKAAMDNLSGSMNDLATMSTDIKNIIKSINEVAFQTNLLALNAAIEAARAGEAGSGFAVVADEVRNLAMRAGDSANTTARLIEQTVSGVQYGTELVEQLNKAFSKAVENVSAVKVLTDEIAGASREQANGIEQITASIAETDKVVHQNITNAETLNESISVFKV